MGTIADLARYNRWFLFFKEFIPSDYYQYYEKKLRNQRQGPDETVTDYLYDVLDLCRTVDRHMGEKKKT